MQVALCANPQLCTVTLLAAHTIEGVATSGYAPCGRLEKWYELSGAALLARESVHGYSYFTRQAVAAKDMEQIEMDVPRTLPHSKEMTAERRVVLRRLLHAHSCHCVQSCYTQGVNVIAATLLLVEPPHDEEEASRVEEMIFWLLCAITDTLLRDYFTSSLLGVRVDTCVLGDLCRAHWQLHDVMRLLDAHDVEIGVFGTRWFMLAFAGTMPLAHVCRVWDLFFTIGSRALLGTAIALVVKRAAALRRADSLEAVYALLSQPQPDDEIDPFMRRVLVEVRALLPFAAQVTD